RNVMKKTVSLVLAMLVIVLALAGCSEKEVNKEVTTGNSSATDNSESSTESEKVEPVSIKFMNYSSSGANEETFAKMVEAFEKENSDVKVEVLTYGYADYFQQLATAIAGGSTPDVFELNIENFRAYVNKGLVSKLEGIDVSTIYPTTLKAFSVDGVQYGLPTKFSNVVLIYNKDLFDQAGISYPTAEWTWKEELEAAQAIRALGDDYFGIFRPIQTWEFYKTIAQNGGALMNEDQSEFTINSEENIEALQMMIDRVNTYNVTPNTEQMGGMGDWDLFKSGRLGMLVNGVWAFSDFTANCDFAWDIVVEPGIKNKATHFFSDAIVVSESSEKKEAATRFAAFIAGSDEAAKLRLEANWDLPVALTEETTNSYLAITPPENKQAVIDSLDYLVMPPSLESFNAIADILNDYLAQAAAEILSPKEALDQAQEEISSQF
ncbi:MAG: sugar ABC transporter substrate-binding protein, partial [Vallitaleaceae bacterium]|nr:sugar ABC transporter substrate-binding protein [Vallitaleaceae bacterium]